MADFMLIDVIMIDSTHHLNLGQRIDTQFLVFIWMCGGGGDGDGCVALFIC